ncbi:hypothetical protein [Catenuloplanes japonicus]|uniref:hypothetical protein n=1 Tax=Catenuloplanes japonicus TaxID=33876 RepID=UPI00068A2D39|nr:hypothetical protein [Catenuloplanes japonicus]
MTKKLAISVPDDVAARLEQEPNVSAFITSAVRYRMAGERTRNALRGLGFQLDEEGIAAAGRQFDEMQQRITPELRSQAEALRDEINRQQAAVNARRAG